MTECDSAEVLTQSYARWRSSRLGRITDELENQLIFEFLGPVDEKRVLDVGCGDGLIASELARRGAHVVGLDADFTMVAAARSRAERESVQLRVIEGRAEMLPFDDAVFDYILAVAVLCFVPDAGRAVAEIARVLKPGGRLVLGELGRWNLWAAHRRVRGWLGSPTWRAAKFRSETDLHHLADVGGLNVIEMRGCVYYPPCALAAQLIAPFDLWLGQRTTLGAAFIAMSATKSIGKALAEHP